MGIDQGNDCYTKETGTDDFIRRFEDYLQPLFQAQNFRLGLPCRVYG